jgi:transposase
MTSEDDTPCPSCGLSKAAFEQLRKRVEEQAQDIAELKKRLSAYENSNTPPSRSLIYKEMKNKRKQEAELRQKQQNGSSNNAMNKPGRKNGHKGVTQTFEPTGKPIVHTLDRCPKCNSRDGLSITSTERRTVVDVPEPLPYNVREHLINVYSCSRCGAADDLIPESARKELPSSTIAVTNQRNSIVALGKNVLSITSLLWSIGRLPRRKLSYAIESLYRLKLSPATIGHALEKVSEKLGILHEKVRNGINRSKRANFDETGMPVAGKKGWIWVAATEKYAFVQVAMSRGKDVLETYFSKFKGVAVVDGWKSYKYFKIIQRCWGHPLRDAEILALRAKGRGREEAEYLLSSLRSLYHETKEELKEEPPPNRKLHDRQLRKLRYILSKKYVDADVLEFVAKLRRASKDLFTFTMHRGVAPTNNHAERELREPIVHRKIRGQLKSDKGIKMFSTLMTAVSTWKLQKLNPFVEFKKYL